MAHLKHATVMGINEAAVRHGLLSWDTEKRAAQACLVVSKRLGGNEAVDSVTPKTAALVFNELKKINNALMHRGMKIASNSVTHKTASARDVLDVAIKAACLAVDVKLAESDGSLTNNEPNTPESAGMTNAVAALDNQNRAPGQYLLGVGNSDMPTGGVDGKEMPHPMQQQQTDVTPNSVTEHSKVSSELRRRGITAQKLSSALKSGTPEQKKQAAYLLGELKKEAQAARGNTVSSAIDRVLGKTAEDDGMSGLFGADPAPNAGGDVSSDDIVSALVDAGIDPNDVSADDVLQALQGDLDAPADAPPESSKKEDKEDDKGEDEKKEAAFLRDLFKLAEGGSLTNVPANTAESAASTNALAELDQKNRKPNEYLNGQGGTSPIGSDGAGQQYDVQKAPKAPEENPSNLVSDETKSAEAHEHLEYLRKVASAYGPKLPASMPRATKIAHVKNLAMLAPGQREAYIAKLSKR